MKAIKRCIIFVLGITAAAVATPGFALEVYQWTDKDGVVHFSQWAPAGDVSNVETLDVQGGGKQHNGLGVSEEDDPDGYQAHRDEMDALWDDINKRREAARKQQASNPTQVVYQNQDQGYLYPYYPRRFRPHPGPRPNPGPRPGPGGGSMEVPVVPSVPFKRP